MSITFSLPMDFMQVARPLISACPSCGGESYGGKKTADPDCQSCWGMGGDSEAESTHQHRITEVDGDLNVANVNGRFIVEDILNLEFDFCGEVIPSVVLMRIAAFFSRCLVSKAPSVEQGVHLTMEGVAPGATAVDCGRSLWQVESYMPRLTRLAEIALERGCNIQWR